jgi:zinc protease
VSAFVYSRELGDLFIVQATAAPGQDPAAMERMMDEEIDRFIKEGPTRRELERVKTESRADFVRGIERIGGFGGKSDILATYQVFAGDPGAYQTMLQRKADATVRDLQQAAKRWISDGQYVLEVDPFPDYTTTASTVDRSTGVPVTETFPEVSFPEIQRATLANGMQVLLAERHTVPLVQFDLELNAGYAADQFGTPGTASLAMNMLDEGTKSRTSQDISEGLAMLGAELHAGSNLDVSSVELSALSDNLEASLDIYADVILNPVFPETEFDRLKKEQLARIKREQATPVSMALRVFPQLLFGKGHAYGIPFTGSGTEASVQSLTREDLSDFHATWFRPNNAKMIVVGNTTLDEIVPKLERLFASWTPGEVPEKRLDPVPQKKESVVYLIDRPESIQSLIIAGNVAPPTANPDEVAIEAMNGVLGSSFNARINMNLREDKHWSYGARSILVDAQGQRPFFVYAPIQSDKTKEAMAEIEKEVTGILGDNPPRADELTRVQDKETLSLPGRWETANRVAGSIGEIARFGLPEDYWMTYPGKVRALTLDDLNRAAKEVLHPDAMVWVVVGDRASIEPGIRELGLGDIVLIDADGNVLEAGDKTELRQ